MQHAEYRIRIAIGLWNSSVLNAPVVIASYVICMHSLDYSSFISYHLIA
jgi:hypothetical protein